MTQQELTRIVGIGASAGGLRALEEFLSAIPEDTGLAFVVVQHLSRDHQSNLAEILSRATNLNVQLLEEDIVPRPNTVYVRPPDKEVVIGEKLELHPRQQNDNTVYLPIDEFFISLARSRKEQAIAIVLSGMGSDGSRGIQEIKEHGGLILVQSPDDAQFSGMPNSALRHQVSDFVGSAKQIAIKLGAIPLLEARTAEIIINDPTGDLTQETFVEAILNRIRLKLKIDFGQYRISTIRRRIEKRLLIHEISDFRTYLDMLAEDEQELKILAQSFLIGVTRFFRDPEAFNRLSEKIIPQLIEAASPNQPLRLWVPACSTGEEAFSLAMIIDNYLTTNDIHREFKILASDVDPQAIRVASEGYFQENIRADVPAAFLEQYFAGVVGGFRIDAKIREKILFAVHNLLSDPPFIKIDLLSCRNFLIYINSEAQYKILSNFHFALNPTGYMMLGPSESLGKLQQAFRLIDRRWKIYSRHHVDYQSLPSRSPRMLTLPGNSSEHKSIASFRPQEINPSEINPPMNDQFAQYLADRYAPPTIFVDQQYKIHYLNGDFENLFKFPRQFASFTLDKVVPDPAKTILVAAVDSVVSGVNTDDNGGLSINVSFEDGNYHVGLRPVAFYEQEAPLIMIEFELAEPTEENGVGSVQTTNDTLLNRQISVLQGRLLESNQRAQKLLAELEATNEELQTSNRELLASNEEMQSTNEELQSVNEELHSVNSEMLRKNDELRLLNNDINHLLESTEIGTLFLDNDLLIRRFTPSIRMQFDLHASDIGRPLSSFSSSFINLNLINKCQTVLEDFQRYEEEIVDRNGNDFLLRIIPYRDLKDEDGGLIVTFIDINERMEARAKLDAMAKRYEAIVQYAEDPILLVNRSGRVEKVNFWLEGGPGPGEVLGRYFTDMIEEDSQQIIFNNALRKIFDENEASKHLIRLNGNEADGVFVEINFIPLESKLIKSGEKTEDIAMLIVDDTTEAIREKYQTQKVLEEYKNRLRSSESQSGIMDLEGNIIDLTKSTSPDLQPEDYINHNVHQFLTDSGSEKILSAFKNLQNGSLQEIVNYEEVDLNIPGDPDARSVLYEPLIANGEVVFVIVKNLSDLPE